MKLRNLLFAGIGTIVVGFVLFFLWSPHHRAQRFVSTVAWQHMATPGELSLPHAFLENNCAACHNSLKGVEAQNCIVCHADNKELLQRQPTAFHAHVSECAACHLEHQGRVASTTKMEHVALAKIGRKMLENAASPTQTNMAQLKRWFERTSASVRHAGHRTAEEALLNCATCHQTKEPHYGFFGANCAECHATSQWIIAEFRHPSSASQSCAQCHQAPPSHYMMHFKMISMKVAHHEHADVLQCFLCHQTTSWNDIKGVGFYKHH